MEEIKTEGWIKFELEGAELYCLWYVVNEGGTEEEKAMVTDDKFVRSGEGKAEIMHHYRIFIPLINIH